MPKQGWHRIMSGWYRYTNAAGKELAMVERYRGFWNVTIYPMADAARARQLKQSPHTYREAKQLAQREYLAATRSGIKRDRETMDRLAGLGVL